MAAEKLREVAVELRQTVVVLRAQLEADHALQASDPLAQRVGLRPFRAAERAVER